MYNPSIANPPRWLISQGFGKNKISSATGT